ncbi:MAG TPA: type II secretion system protein GspC [Kofleriaceae bacterium]|nr:type II secretion system protein GspC [Kofleriaceae bacterium]
MLVRLLEHHQRLLRVAAVAVCALAGARAALHVFDAMDGTPAAWAAEPPKRAPSAGAAVAAPTAASKSGAALVERNLFCSDCVAPPDGAVGPVAPASSEPPVTALPLHLIATHVATAGPGRSSAMVLDGASSNQGAYRMGEHLPGAGSIVRIGGRSIDFENPAAGRVERLAIAEPAAPKPPGPAAEQPGDDAPPANRRDRAADPELKAALDAGVRAIDETTFEVDRGLIESVIARPQSAARGARVALRDGGLRLSAVRPDSAHAHLGLKSGDTILAVNGVELSSPDKMLEAVTALRNESNISLSITRRREPVTLTYRVR